jgi:hypothetical protein
MEGSSAGSSSARVEDERRLARRPQIEAAYSVYATKTNAPIRTIVPATMTTRKTLAIPTNAGMPRFVRYVGGCRPGDDSHRLIWEAVCS